MPDNSLILGLKKLTLFIYRSEGARCNRGTLHDKLHGCTVIRIKKDEYGRTEHKKYSYPGIPHRDITQQVLIADRKNARTVEELFNRFRVSYIKCPSPVFVRWDLPPPRTEKLP